MALTQISVQKFSVTSAKSFESVVAAIDAVVSHPDPSRFSTEIGAATTWAATEIVIGRMLGISGFMEFIRFDLGAILRKESGQAGPKNVRLVIGNPLIMKEMAKHVPDAGCYAPVSVLIDERPDGVHLSYDTLASLLAPYESAEALEVARALDSKLEKLLTEAAGL
jgi:uncharacterized protein (DUF302 family)